MRSAILLSCVSVLATFASTTSGTMSNSAKLAPRVNQPMIAIERVNRECTQDSQCSAPSPCLEATCFVGWCSWRSNYEFQPPSSATPQCYLGRELTFSQIAAECGAQLLEARAEIDGNIYDFNLRHCNPENLVACRAEEEASLRRSLRRYGEVLLRCIAADPTLTRADVPTCLPWDQTHPRGAYIVEPPPVTSAESHEKSHDEGVTDSSEGDATLPRGNTWRGPGMWSEEDNIILEGTDVTE